jgi:hypothetical protein
VSHYIEDIELDNLSDPSKGGDMGDAPYTPTQQTIKPQVKDEIDRLGQWTYVGLRKKFKPKVPQ